MKESIGVVNPNLLEQEPNLLVTLFGAIAGLVMALMISGMIAFIMKSSFNTRINAASFIAANALASATSITFIVVMVFYSSEIWIVSSAMLWCAVYMFCLHLLQPPSLEQLIKKTQKDVEKLEKEADKIAQKEQAKANKAKSKFVAKNSDKQS